MMPLLALGLVVFAALVYACVCRFTGQEKDDHQVIQFPSERKSRWKKLNTTSDYTAQKKDAESMNNVIFLSSVNAARRR
ncbi:MAG: hypothetical protein ACI4W2_04465 [Eubacterium sp.]